MGNLQSCMKESDQEDMPFYSKSLNDMSIGQYNISIVQQQVVETHTDCILALQDQFMNFLGNSSLSIKKRAGKEVEEECTKVLQKKGKLKRGQIYKTHGGNLNQEYILHMNFPIIKNKITGSQKAYILELVKDILEYCFYELDLDSIALPLLVEPLKGDPEQTQADRVAACLLLKSIKLFVENEKDIRMDYQAMARDRKNSNSQQYDPHIIGAVQFNNEKSIKSSFNSDYDTRELKQQKHNLSYIQQRKKENQKKIIIVNQNPGFSGILEEEFQDVFIFGAPINLRKSMVRSTFTQSQTLTSESYTKGIQGYTSGLVDKQQQYKRKSQQVNQKKDPYTNFKISEDQQEYGISPNNSQQQFQSQYQSSVNISDIFEMTPGTIKINSKKFQSKKKSDNSIEPKESMGQSF